MKALTPLIEIFPLISTLFTAIISSFYETGRKWQNLMIAILGILFAFFSVIFFADVFPQDSDVSSVLDIRYNKISAFVGMLYCGSLFIGLFPIRRQVQLSTSFLLSVAGGIGIILANNLPTFLLFWSFQRLLPFRGFIREGKGGTYIFQHILTFFCFIALLVMAWQANVIFLPMTEIPVSFFTWPVLILLFVIIYSSHGIFPFHSWIHDLLRNCPWYEFSAIFLARGGVLLFAQLLLPTLEKDPDMFRALLITFSILSSLYWSFRGLLEKDLIIKVKYFFIAQASLVLTGMQADLTALKGSYLHMLVISIAGTSMFSILNYVHHTFSFKRPSHFYGLSQYFPKMATYFCLFGFCMIGVPIGASFVVEDLVITGLLHHEPVLGLGHIMATCLNAILFFLIFTKIFLGPTPYRDEVKSYDMKSSELIPYLAGLILLVLIGIVPSLFLEKITW